MDIESLYRKYRPELLSYAVKLTKCRDTAEDLVEEAFVKAMNYQTDEELGLNWLKRVAKNIFYNTYKREKRMVDIKEAEMQFVSKRGIEITPEIRESLKQMTMIESYIMTRLSVGQTQEEIAKALGTYQRDISRKLAIIRLKLKKFV